MPSLRIGVPPGTVVKRGAGGRLLGELVNPGELLAVTTWQYKPQVLRVWLFS